VGVPIEVPVHDAEVIKRVCTRSSKKSFEPATGEAPVNVAAELAADLCERHVAAACGAGIDGAAAGKDSSPDSRMT
jgi:hypothetical protein